MESLNQKRSRLQDLEDQLKNTNWNEVDTTKELKEELELLKSEIQELESQIKELPPLPDAEAIPSEVKTIPHKTPREHISDMRKILEKEES